MQAAASIETLAFERDGYLVCRGLCPEALRARLLDVCRQHLEVQPDAAPRQMRYKALLMQTARSGRGFDGVLQLVVNTRQGGKAGGLTVPPSTGARKGEGLPVSFRRYQRVEGMFEVPAGAVVTSVQIRVLEAGAVRAQQTVTM